MIERNCLGCGASMLIDAATQTVWHKQPECEWFLAYVKLHNAVEVQTPVLIVVIGDSEDLDKQAN